MSLPKGCVDWLICDWYIMTSFFPNTKIPRIVSPCSCCSQSHQEIHFLCVYLFSDDMMAVRRVTVRVRYEMVETDREGRTSTHETGRWLSADGAWSFQWSFAASCLGPQIRFHPAAADSPHTAHSIFAPQRRSLHTHNTTQHQNRFRAGLRSKTSLKIFFANIFHEINTVLRQYLRA